MRDRSTIVFRTIGWNLGLAGMALVFVLVGIVTATHGGIATQIVFSAFASVSFIAALRAYRAGVIVTDRAVTVRGFARTHRLPWDDIAKVSTGSSGNITGAGRCVVIGLKSGRTIPARGCGSYSSAKVEQTARAIADLRPDDNLTAATD